MRSKYLDSLNGSKRNDLRMSLWQAQKGKCFICEESIDLQLHKDNLDIDHVQPLKTGGKDNPSNFALTHDSCNRSKQSSDLRVARVLAKFEKLRQQCNANENRSPNLNDILVTKDKKFELTVKVEGNNVQFSFPDIGDNTIYTCPLYHDELSGQDYFFAKFPIEYLFHDHKINPRSIGRNLSGLVKEFFDKKPQLHVSLGWIEPDSDNKGKIAIFDGQHKAAAQVLLGIQRLPVRVFLNPDRDILLEANTNAGTKLRQVAFDKSVQRHLGSRLYVERVEQYQKAYSLNENDFSFSEKALVTHFKGESREMKKFILDAQRDKIIRDPENKLKDYVDFGGRGKEKPLSYSTIEKTFYSFFIYQDPLETPLNYLLEEGENPREIEKSQIIDLMNIIAEEIFIEKFSTDIGTHRIESNIQKGEHYSEDHLIAFRLSHEEIIYNWLKLIQKIIHLYFLTLGKAYDEKKFFQYKFDPQLWTNIRNFVRNLVKMPVWVNKDLASSAFGGKRTYLFWQTIFETGKTPQNQPILPQPIDLTDMIKAE